jgi:hypothetical protein
MRVMVFAKATEDSEKGVPPTTEAFEAMDQFTEELVKAGVMLAGAGLKPSAPVDLPQARPVFLIAHAVGLILITADQNFPVQVVATG